MQNCYHLVKVSIWPKIIGWGYSLLFMLVPLIWLPQTSELFEFPKIILTYILTIFIVGAWIARCLTEKKFIFRRTPLDIPLALFLLINLISFIFSIDLHISWYGYYSRWNGGLLSLIVYSVLYWAFVSNLDRKAALFAIRYSLIAAVTVSLYGSLEHFGFSPSCLLTRGTFGVDCWVQDVQTRVFATLGQPNWMAAYLAALIWIPISKLRNSQFTIFPAERDPALRGNFQTISNLLIFSLLFAALLFTKSRSGLLAFGISSLVYWGIYVIRLGQLEIRSIRNLLVFVTVTVILTALIPNPARDLIIKSTTPPPTGPALEVGGTESGSIRKIVWTGALRIWQGSPKNFLIGTGPETFALAYYQFRPVEHNLTSEWELLYNKAHNEFLNYLATTGLAGLTSYLVLLLFMVRNFQFSIFNSKSIFQISNFKFQIENQPENRLLILALFSGWLTILVTNFWGFSVVVSQLFLWLFPALALALEPESGRAGEYKLGRGQLLAILLLALTPALLLFYSTLRYFLADVRYASGSLALKSFQATLEPGYLLGAYQAFSQAFKLNPAEPAIAAETAVAAAYLANALRQSDATSAAALAQQSLSLSQLSISISPHHPNYYKSRARTMILLSDVDSRYLPLAAESLAKAAEISPTDPRIPHNLGVIYSNLGATPSAVEQFAKSLQLKPDFADAAKQLQEMASSSSAPPR